MMRVSIKTLKNGNYLLGVHIADVTHYVVKDSVLWTKKLGRGRLQSIWWNKVVPMLPGLSFQWSVLAFRKSG